MHHESKILRGFAKALAAAAIAAAPALAQSADPFDKAMQGAAPSGQPVGALRVPEAPDPADAPPGRLSELAKEVGKTPVPAADASGPVRNGPGGGTAAPSPAPTGAPPAASPNAGPAGGDDGQDRSAEILGNYDATLDIYKNILDKQGTDPANIDRRIQSNEEMIGKYRPQLAQAQSELRKMQVEFMNRAFQLKQQKESGQITEEMFGKLITQEEMKQGHRKEALAQDVAFYKDEMTQAEIRLKDLREQRRLVAERAAREGKLQEPKKKPGEALLQGLSGQLEKLSAFQTRFTMDGNVRCRACNDFPHTSPPPQQPGDAPPAKDVKEKE